MKLIIAITPSYTKGPAEFSEHCITRLGASDCSSRYSSTRSATSHLA
jgi:hypothetical protein